ncbi:hypothetical protein [Leucobacter denitrificans]|uniref:Uncharacterized protein n=1 Tax=Leucobacter denitrificans TaxID=683042 RepID=A0A7G9S730_9MICO|nr:hypothetical protein [Leucobacter denitrificans]QNN63655.1 hypothetical protein H9L06_04980 [Leucobacter denitrificans]
MSDTHDPQFAESQAQTAHETSTFAQGYAAQTQSPAAAPKKMSTFLKVSIILLIGLTVASISLLFIGDFEGRFERVFSTFALFAVFVVFTAIDTSREKQNDWYAPVALIANTYILGLLLIVIWITPYDAFSLMFEIFWKSVLVIVVTRLVILCCELLLRAGAKSGGATNTFAFITSVLAVLSGILFTAPVGIEAFELEIPDLYWKIATAVLILTALGLSVTLLLRWASGSDERAARRESARAAEAQAFAVQGYAGQPYVAQQYGSQQYAGQGYGGQSVAGQTYPAQPYAAQYPPQDYTGQANENVAAGYEAQNLSPQTNVAPQASVAETRVDQVPPAESQSDQVAASPVVDEVMIPASESAQDDEDTQASATLLQPEGFQFQQRAHDAQQQAAPMGEPVVESVPVPEPQSDFEPEPELLPWPTFADGSPIPAGPDGQPDFSVPGAPQPPQL